MTSLCYIDCSLDLAHRVFIRHTDTQYSQLVMPFSLSYPGIHLQLQNLLMTSPSTTETTVYTSPQDAPQDASNELHRAITSITNLESSHVCILETEQVRRGGRWVSCDKNNHSNFEEAPVSNCKRGNSNQVQKELH